MFAESQTTNKDMGTFNVCYSSHLFALVALIIVGLWLRYVCIVTIIHHSVFIADTHQYPSDVHAALRVPLCVTCHTPTQQIWLQNDFDLDLDLVWMTLIIINANYNVYYEGHQWSLVLPKRGSSVISSSNPGPGMKVCLLGLFTWRISCIEHHTFFTPKAFSIYKVCCTYQNDWDLSQIGNIPVSSQNMFPIASLIWHRYSWNMVC